MEPYEVTRDSALRGWWVTGLGDVNKIAQAALLKRDGGEVFIPDKVLALIRGNDGKGKSCGSPPNPGDRVWDFRRDRRTT